MKDGLRYSEINAIEMDMYDDQIKAAEAAMEAWGNKLGFGDPILIEAKFFDHANQIGVVGEWND